jgi:hypothetical protein
VFNQPFPNFGTGISTAGGLVSSVVLQPGIYQIHFHGDLGVPCFNCSTAPFFLEVSALLNNFDVADWRTFVSGTDFAFPGGDHLLSVTTPNSTLTLVASSDPIMPSIVFNGGCTLVITQLH